MRSAASSTICFRTMSSYGLRLAGAAAGSTGIIIRQTSREGLELARGQARGLNQGTGEPAARVLANGLRRSDAEMTRGELNEFRQRGLGIVGPVRSVEHVGKRSTKIGLMVRL